MLVNIATILFSTLFKSPTLRSGTRNLVNYFISFLHYLFFLCYHHLINQDVRTIIPICANLTWQWSAWQAPALVDTPTLSAIETRNHTLTELTSGSVPSWPALASVFLDTLAFVQTWLLTNASFTAPTLHLKLWMEQMEQISSSITETFWSHSPSSDIKKLWTFALFDIVIYIAERYLMCSIGSQIDWAFFCWQCKFL